MLCYFAAAFNEGQQNTFETTEPNNNKRKAMKKLIIISLALTVAAVASVRAADVKENWEKSCSKCHGTDGKGKTKMGEKLQVKDYTEAKVQEELKDDKLTKAIKDGVKDGDKVKMKGFGDALSDDEIKALVKFIRDFKK